MLGQELDEIEVGEWLQADTGDRGYEHLSDAEIIVEVTSEPTQDLSDDETETVTEPSGDSSCVCFNFTWASRENVRQLHNLAAVASPHNLSVLRDL